MIKIKLFSCLVVFCLAAQVLPVKAEYHEVQPGDVLSKIAEKKRIQSGFLLSTEQIMLTLYKLNKAAFVGGDINQLVIAEKILIPDNTADYIQLTKTEAQRRLHDKSYLRGLARESNAEAPVLMGDVTPKKFKAPKGYDQIVKTLENHQQNIDALKHENERLTNKFNLLDKALGRVVMVQGLLTNDLVDVKAKVSGTPAPVEKVDVSEGARLVQETPPALEQQSKIESAQKSEASAALFEAEPPVMEAPSTEDAATSLAENSVKVGDEIKDIAEPLAPEAPIVAEPLETIEAPMNVEATPAMVNTAEQTPASFISKLNSLALSLIIAGAVLAALTGWWFYRFNKERTGKLSIKLGEEEDISIVGLKTKASEINHFDVNTPLQKEDSHSVKLVADEAKQAMKAPQVEPELSSVLELLDMCLLCGDYEQAHSVTLKAMAEHQSSAVLAKKLSFIERKMAKL